MARSGDGGVDGSWEFGTYYSAQKKLFSLTAGAQNGEDD